jgi:Fic family protein
MNSYYSNLIEGHDTHPLDIEKALKNDFSKDKINRNLQIEAYAHINLHKFISDKFATKLPNIIPTSVEFLKEIHKNFYEHLPAEFKNVISKDNEKLKVTPGEFRVSEVEVGRHIAPFSKSVDHFVNRFENFYDPTIADNKSKIRRVISIAASHHRLVWIHPFLDGNGRVVRLFSDASFMYEDLHSSGLWSISRGLARSNNEYKSKLANADLPKLNNYDGRGNLSNKYLIEFCTYFLNVAIDQINFMSRVIDAETMAKRLDAFGELMALRGYFKPEAKYILVELF